MLTAGASEVDLQILETALKIVVNRLENKHLNVLQEVMHIRLVFQKLYDIGIFASHFLVFSVTSGVWQCPAVENVTSAVAALVVGNTAVFV